jgi:hypothetical protein
MTAAEITRAPFVCRESGVVALESDMGAHRCPEHDSLACVINVLVIARQLDENRRARLVAEERVRQLESKPGDA